MDDVSTSTLIRPRDDAALRIESAGRAHLVGAAGAGMQAMADVLHDAGWTLSGSDPRAGTLRNPRFDVAGEHRAEAVDSAVGLVVYSDAVPIANPELERARELGIPVLGYPQLLGQLSETRTTAAVAGTHGKSTTTAMAAQILSTAGGDPTVIYGATPIDRQNRSRLGRGRWLLAEACEFRENFRHLQPDIAVVLGIEHDHVDCFDAPDDVEAAFSRFAAKVPAEGLVLARADCPATRRACRRLVCASETFGFSVDATWQATALRERCGYYSFQLRCRRRLVCEVKLSVPGRHNVVNALAAAALASHCGASGTVIGAGLSQFAGLRRRTEPVADDGFVALVDDYAHHPAAMTAALQTVRQMYPARRLWCLFEPHQSSRTIRLLDQFARTLHNADRIVVTEVFPAREETGVARAVSADLVERLKSLGAHAVFRSTAEEIVGHLQSSVQPGDVFAVLGAGDIGAVAHELGKRFRTIRKAG